MRYRHSKTGGFTIAELLLAMALMGLIMSAIAYGMYGAENTSEYNTRRAELLVHARGVLDRIAADVWRADATLASNDNSAVSISFARRLPGGGEEIVWRQYRKEVADGGTIIAVYEDSNPIAMPPAAPASSATRAVLASNVKTFNVWSEITSSRTITETLSCQITATCGPNRGNTFTIPLEEGPYVLKLSQSQYDQRPPRERVDYLPRPEYEPDDDPNTYWLCLEDAQAPPVQLPNGDWDHNDFMLKVTETPTSVDMEVHWGTAAYDRDVMGPDGELLYGDLGGTHTYTYTPYVQDSDKVRVELELENGNVQTGTTITATQRKSLF
ncbi:MAG TPA: hypothetical protein VM238_20190 [Phycisphaerae bacterium]|nr:hypothetical protein [Phycisphaerae bacterium]